MTILSEFTIHFGLLASSPNDKPVIPPGFICDVGRESFLVWGEPNGEDDLTTHVMVGTNYNPAPGYGFVNHEVGYKTETSQRRDLREQIARCRKLLASYQPTGVRLIDYVCVTPTEDWSADPSAIGTLEGGLS